MAASAFVQGVIGASSLAIGASVGVFLRPHRIFSATVMAFGSGTLIAALAFEIASKVFAESGFWPLVIGFTIGGVLFTFFTEYIDNHGGFLRNPASSRRYLLEHRENSPESVLERISHVEVLRHLPEAEKKALVGVLSPIYANSADTLCREGDEGDCLYFIISGQAYVWKGQRKIAILNEGDIFGEMSLLTGEPRSATVIAQTDMELYQLNRDNFTQVLSHSPYLAWALSRVLARRLQRSVESQVKESPSLQDWENRLMETIEIDRLIYEDPQTLAKLVRRSAPLAIMVGTLIDNIPEALVIGMNSGLNHIGWSFLVAVFISNFPEALSSASGMKQAGTPRYHILALWYGVVVMSGVMAMGGHWLQYSTSTLVIAIARATAGGAILAMLASTMMPEAYELGGSSVSYSTIAGFLVGFLVASLGF